MEIYLVRHGRPSVVNRYSPVQIVRGADCHHLIEEYNASGIDDGLPPPQGLVDCASAIPAAYASSLARAHQSARMLGLGAKLTCDPVFDEAGIPYGFLKNWLMPAGAWMGIARLIWFFGYAKNCAPVSQARQRAKIAAGILLDAASAHGSVMLVGHGCMNGLIYLELKKHQWRRTSRYGNRYWAANRLVPMQ